MIIMYLWWSPSWSNMSNYVYLNTYAILTNAASPTVIHFIYIMTHGGSASVSTLFLNTLVNVESE